MNWSGFLQPQTAHVKLTIAYTKKASSVFALVVLMMGTCFSQSSPTDGAVTQAETLAVVPFENHGLSREDGLLLAKRFAEVLRASNRFRVILQDSMESSAKMRDPHSLAETGKTLGVLKVVDVSIVHRDKLWVLQIRLVNVVDAALLYAERVDYSGEFGSVLSDVIPEQARKLTQAHLDAKTPWAKAAFLFGACLGAILWIFWHFRRKEANRS